MRWFVWWGCAAMLKAICLLQQRQEVCLEQWEQYPEASVQFVISQVINQFFMSIYISFFCPINFCAKLLLYLLVFLNSSLSIQFLLLSEIISSLNMYYCHINICVKTYVYPLGKVQFFLKHSLGRHLGREVMGKTSGFDGYRASTTTIFFIIQ